MFRSRKQLRKFLHPKPNLITKILAGANQFRSTEATNHHRVTPRKHTALLSFSKACKNYINSN